MVRRLTAVAVLTVAAGCTSLDFGFQFDSTTQTVLSRDNFQIVKPNARGEDWGFYLFGLLPIMEPSITDAVGLLYDGMVVEGRPLSLIHVTRETRHGYFLLFSLSQIIVRADVIEFVPAKSDAEH